jgi:hypothetical protein
MEEAPTARATASTRASRLRRAGWALALFAGLAAFLGACGGASAGSGPSSSPSSSAGAPAGASSQGSQTGAVAFAQCMRSHGVTNFPDPQSGHFLVSGNVQSSPNFQPAVQACQHLLGPNGASSGGGSNNSQLLAFAHCMQTHGVPQFPDPTANGGIGLPQGVDPNSPTFQTAWHKCQSKLPGNLQGQQP